MSSLLSPTAAEMLNVYTTAEYARSGIVSQTLLQTPLLRLTLFAFNQGQELTEHRSERRAVVQILEGTCDFYFNGTWQQIGPGTLLHMPGGHLHAVRATTPLKFLLTLVRDESVEVIESKSP